MRELLHWNNYNFCYTNYEYFEYIYIETYDNGMMLKNRRTVSESQILLPIRDC